MDNTYTKMLIFQAKLFTTNKSISPIPYRPLFLDAIYKTEKTGVLASSISVQEESA